MVEITATAVKTIEQIVQDSLKRALPEDFVNKTTVEAVKRIESCTVPQFKNKGNKIRYEGNKSIMEKIDETTSAIEKLKTERCQEKLTEGKKTILKQKKLLRIADRDEEGWEVEKCHLSEDLTSESEDEKHPSRARREAAGNKKAKENKKRKKISK